MLVQSLFFRLRDALHSCFIDFQGAVATLQLAGMDELINLDALKKLTPDEQNNLIAGMKQQAALLNAQNLITVSCQYITLVIRVAGGETISSQFYSKMVFFKIDGDLCVRYLLFVSFLFLDVPALRPSLKNCCS